jgi:Protein of unknown function (DUF2851)
MRLWTPSPFPKARCSATSRLLSEDELVDVWQQRAYANHYLVDCCGRHLKVVFPGRRWGGPGPDFVGAVLADSDGTLLRGDVEVHRRASAWAAHGHAGDPAYAQVVLHVVQRADALALDGAGGHVPTVQLDPEPGRGPATPEAVPCLRQANSVLQVVEAAGRQRFQSRVARFEGDLSVAAPDQVLWRGVAEAVGFRRNTRAFGALAEAVPWCQAAGVLADRGPVGLAGLLLGSAGLLAEATLPEAHAWRALQRTLGLRAALRPASWDRRQVRPASAPAARCRGLAELAAGWLGIVPRAELGASLNRANARADLAHAARGSRCPELSPAGGATVGVRLGPAEYVVEQIAQAAATPRRPSLWRLGRASPWIGAGRAQVIAVNVLLPFAAAAGVGEAASLFERAAGEPSNRVLRYMAGQLGGGGTGIRFSGACHQQGLLHLFQHMCAARICERCPARAVRRLSEPPGESAEPKARNKPGGPTV